MPQLVNVNRRFPVRNYRSEFGSIAARLNAGERSRRQPRYRAKHKDMDEPCWKAHLDGFPGTFFGRRIKPKSTTVR